MKKKKTPSVSWSVLARRHPSAFLLAAQLVSLVLYAFFDGSTNGRALLGAFGVLVLMLVVSRLIGMTLTQQKKKES